MKRSSFIKSLGVLAGAAFIPKPKPERLTLPNYTSNADMNIGVERMRITSSGNVGMGMLNPKQILKVTKRVNGGMPSLYNRIK
jgi:hypothetical protein